MPFNLVNDDGTLLNVLVNVASCRTPLPRWVFQTHLIYLLWFFNPFNALFYYSTHFSEFGTTVSFRMNNRFFHASGSSILLPWYICISYTPIYIPYIHTHTHNWCIYIYTNLIDFLLFSLCCVTHVPQNIASCVFSQLEPVQKDCILWVLWTVVIIFPCQIQHI